MLAKEIGLLYVGGLNSPFGEIKVTKTLRQLDKKIIECSWDYEKNQWSFMRERTDKSFPNAYATAEGLFFLLLVKCFAPLPYNPLSHPRSFVPLISAPTGFHNLGMATRWGQPLITSNYYLPSTPKDQSTMRSELCLLLS